MANGKWCRVTWISCRGEQGTSVQLRDGPAAVTDAIACEFENSDAVSNDPSQTPLTNLQFGDSLLRSRREGGLIASVGSQKTYHLPDAP